MVSIGVPPKAPERSDESESVSAMSTPVYQESRELLFGHLNAEEIQRWLMPVGFTDWEATHRRLLRIAERSEARPALADLLPYLLTMLADAGNPDRVLVNIERFLKDGPAMPDQIRYLAHNLRATEILVKLFAGSQFLTEILLRNPEYFDMLVEYQGLAQAKTVEAFHGDLASRQGAISLDDLRRFQRRELLRIGTCDLLGLFDLSSVTSQLSNLADCLIQSCLSIAIEEVENANKDTGEGFAVLALGKLGGQELNYSSDVDLLFLTRGDTTRCLPTAERLIEGLSSVTGEGFLYRVDMRLRPWGSTGSLITSVDGYLTYLQDHARVWEKQALLKGRFVAGDSITGNAFLDRANRLIFDVSACEAHRNASMMKRLIEDHLRQHGGGWGEVKLGQGSIRDIEFVAQYLQLIHSTAQQAIGSHNTLESLTCLTNQGLLSSRDWRILTDGYVFLRTIEHYLQMMHYQQTHRLPQDLNALAQLAHRLGFEGTAAGARLIARYEQHRAAIRAVYLRYLGEQPRDTSQEEYQAVDISRAHVSRMDASYTDVFTPREIRRHAQLAAQLNQDHLVEIEAISLPEDRWRITIVGYDYPGELSLICGLLFVYGFSIEEGQVFTYEAPAHQNQDQHHTVEPRKIVDAFTVRAIKENTTSETWRSYARELAALLEEMRIGRGQAARGALAKRVAASISEITDTDPTLYPVEIQIDNASSDQYTALHITAPDTIGFLYELTNALAYRHLYIGRVNVASFGDHAHDTLLITDATGQKIVAPEKLRELRAAVVLIKHFTHLLPKTPDPETALLHFREFISHLFRQPDWPDEIASLENPDVLNALARLLGVSEFLWDDFLRMQYANLFPVVRDTDALQTKKSRRQLQIELQTALAFVHNGPQIPPAYREWRKALNAFKDREMFRIDMRHILGHTQEFWDFSEELTNLVEVVVNAAYHLCHEDLRAQYGAPHLDGGAISEMSVCALGKCGGRELGFGSDIELMFIYGGNGITSGPEVITTAEFYEKLVRMFLQVIEARREGIFEIDLQLRPYGKAGSMAVSLEAFRRYFAQEGPAWAYERQALVKLRSIAGDHTLGKELGRLRDRFLYGGEGFDVTAMRAMRERQIRHLVTGGTFNAKYSPGGLVDVEYLVQGLQIIHGARNPTLRSTNIRETMRALMEAAVLSAEDYSRLRRAHTFLRWLIDGLRMVRGNAKDLTVPPINSEGFAFLARRLRYGEDTRQLQHDLTQHTTSVRQLNHQLLG